MRKIRFQMIVLVLIMCVLMLAVWLTFQGAISDLDDARQQVQNGF